MRALAWFRLVFVIMSDYEYGLCPLPQGFDTSKICTVPTGVGNTVVSSTGGTCVKGSDVVYTCVSDFGVDICVCASVEYGTEAPVDNVEVTEGVDAAASVAKL